MVECTFIDTMYHVVYSQPLTVFAHFTASNFPVLMDSPAMVLFQVISGKWGDVKKLVPQRDNTLQAELQKQQSILFCHSHNVLGYKVGHAKYQLDFKTFKIFF